MKRLLKVLLAVFIVFATAGYVFLVLLRGRTPAIRDSEGHVLPGSVAVLEPVEIGGEKQWILIRGRNRANPVLLFLHGGPGMPAMYLAHAFQRELENDFVIVHWDRRGVGKSYRRDLPMETLTDEQLISDTVELVDLLRQRFGQQKIFLVGHSWGTYLGMLVVERYPERFHAYIGIGQEAHLSRSREIQLHWLRAQAEQANNRKALADLNAYAPRNMESWLFEYGGELRGARSWLPLMMTGLGAPEYDLFDMWHLPAGVNLVNRNLKQKAIEGELLDHITSVKVPVYFFLGRHDYTTPSELAVKLHDKLIAPVKRIVWFEESAHFPFLEEPARFTAEMGKILQER